MYQIELIQKNQHCNLKMEVKMKQHKGKMKEKTTNRVILKTFTLSMGIFFLIHIHGIFD